MKKIVYFLPLMVLSLLTGCNSNNLISISLNTEEVSITPNAIQKGSEYNGTITVSSDNKYLNESLDYVKCGDIEINDYQYKPDEDLKTASLIIPANETINDINVGITLQNSEDLIFISLSTEEASITPRIIKKGSEYNGTITVLSDNKYLPESLDYVNRDYIDIDYQYKSDEDLKTASLVIPANETTNDIDVGITLQNSEDLRYLCFTAEEDNSSVAYTAGSGISSSIHIRTSTDAQTWTDWDGSQIVLNNNEKVYVKNTKNTLSKEIHNPNIFQFVMTGKIAASGNVNSMINFKRLTNYCFANMFNGCASLTKAPELPSTITTEQCYFAMFEGCSSLVIPPDLPATHLSYECYFDMFCGCTSLIAAPSFIATSLDFGCCSYMFHNCTSLIEAPELPATTLADECYFCMFENCTSLIEAPELPATTLLDDCYYGMFKGCTSLEVSEGNNGAQIFTCPDTKDFPDSIANMFKDTGGTFTGDPEKGMTYCYKNHALCFVAKQNNSSISYSIKGSITASIQTSTDQETYENWDGTPITLNVGQKIYVKNTEDSLSIDDNNYLNFAMTGKIAASGNVNSMIQNNELSSHCYTHLFDKCEALVKAPLLPAKTLAEYCYSEMFAGCTSLIVVPYLHDEILARHCYSEMFAGCTSLINTPILPAKTLAEYCYSGMFSNCTSLTNVPVLLAKNLSKGCYQNMFLGCSSVISVPQLLATTLVDECYNNMFNGCTSLMINEDSETGINIFTCPDTTGLTAPTDGMFLNTSGSFTGNPTTEKKYNYYHNNPEDLCLIAEADNSSVGYVAGSKISSSIHIEVSIDEQTWISWDGSYILLDKDDKIYVRNTKDTLSVGMEDSNCFQFVMKGKIAASGNVNSLISGSKNLTDYCFYGLFYECSALTKAFISLPSLNLAKSCYRQMFYECSSLISGPEILPAQTLTSSCYSDMFEYCPSLTTTPIISATTLDNWSCCEMFYSCSKLKISEEEIGRKIFTCPSEMPDNAVSIMFEGTGGTFRGTPTANKNYYCY